MEDFFHWLDDGKKWFDELFKNAGGSPDPDARKTKKVAKDTVKDLSDLEKQVKAEQDRLDQLKLWRKKHEAQRKELVENFKKLKQSTTNKDMKAVYDDRIHLVNWVHDRLDRDNLLMQEDILRKGRIKANSILTGFRKHQKSLSQAKSWKTIYNRSYVARQFTRQSSASFLKFRKQSYMKLKSDYRTSLTNYNKKIRSSTGSKPSKKLKAYNVTNLRVYVGSPP